MRILLIAAAVAAGALTAVGVLGVAGAETTTTATTAPASAPLRTVSVQGVASAPVAPEASAATATAVYRQAMASAVTDGQSKAQYLAEKAGATLGAAERFTFEFSAQARQEALVLALYEGDQPFTHLAAQVPVAA